MGRNGNPVKQWEVTFPQVSEEASKETWHENFPPSTYSISCCEKHADGGIHLHMGIVFKHGISKPNLLDYIAAKYPCSSKRIHISPIRVMSQWQAYCKKEDPYPFERGSLKKNGQKYTDADAMRDIMIDLFRVCEMKGEQRKYELSEENHLRQKYQRELNQEGSPS